jgi:hypothetical protein
MVDSEFPTQMRSLQFSRYARSIPHSIFEISHWVQ